MVPLGNLSVSTTDMSIGIFLISKDTFGSSMTSILEPLFFISGANTSYSRGGSMISYSPEAAKVVIVESSLTVMSGSTQEHVFLGSNLISAIPMLLVDLPSPGAFSPSRSPPTTRPTTLRSVESTKGISNTVS